MKITNLSMFGADIAALTADQFKNDAGIDELDALVKESITTYEGLFSPHIDNIQSTRTTLIFLITTYNFQGLYAACWWRRLCAFDKVKSHSGAFAAYCL